MTSIYKPWTADEIAILEDHRRRTPPTPWKQIAALLPGREVSAAKAKWAFMHPELRPGTRGRPRVAPPEPVAGDDAQVAMDPIRRGTKRLGDAIEAMLARQRAAAERIAA